MDLGSEFAGYRVEAILGRGGMGVVYRAEHLRLRRPVALKVLAPQIADNESFRARFVRESQLAAAIDDPNIIPIYEAGEADGEFFIAMRYVDGTDLEARLADGALDPPDALRILTQVASALDAAHAAGLVHRDVKPGNILIDHGRGGAARQHVYLTDFGLTKRADSQSGLTAYGSFVGSIDYIAPEQIRGQQLDGRADIYALGCVAYRCLTGRLPFERDADMAMLWAHVHETPAPASGLNPELPAEVDAVLARAMAKEPDERQPTGEAFITELRAALAPLVQPTQPEAASRRSLLLAAAAFGGLMLLASGSALAVVGPERLSGMLSGASPAPEAVPAANEPTPTPTAPARTRDPTIFPNADEEALLARVPSAVRGSCERAQTVTPSYQGLTPLRDEMVPFRTSLAVRAGLYCFHSGVAAWYWETRVPPTLGVTIQTSAAGHAEEFVVGYGANQGLSLGTCGPDGQTRERWQVGRWSGNLLCYEADGAAVIDWTYTGEPLYVRALRDDGDMAALLDWWRHTGRLLSR